MRVELADPVERKKEKIMYSTNKQMRRQDGPRSAIGSRLNIMSGLIAAAIMLGSIVFPNTALGHDIDVNQARQSLHWYSVAVAQNGRYDDNPSIDCKKMFPHQVRCRVSYKRSSLKQTCSEDITVYFVAHMGSRRDWTYYQTHINPAARCGFTLLTGPRP